MSSSWIIYAIGLLAQALFSARILVQWVLSEKARKVVSPTIFWILSFIASFIFFFYGWLREDFSIMLGQVIGYYVYVWNLWIKGVWSKLPAKLGKSALSVFIVIPIIAILSMVLMNDDIIATLFQNEKLPLWLLVWGSAGQVIFSFRFIYQFIYSKRRQESLLPAGFWIISLIGSSLIVSYGIIRLDPVLILGQGIGFISYTRNLILWRRNNK